MADIIINAQVGVSGVNNGSIITFVQETGSYQRLDPPINHYVPSGTLNTNLSGRFLLDYGGGPS